MSNANVLIVDDEDALRDVMIRRLRMAGIHADGVGAGEQALELLSTCGYDVIILDVKMPGISGIEVLKRLRVNGCPSEVIVLSGHASLDAAVELMEQGAYDYMMKPYDLEELIEKILRAQDRKLDREA